MTVTMLLENTVAAAERMSGFHLVPAELGLAGS
jgi:hypothetical protein